MRDYARIGPQFWIGKTGKELRKRGAECQVVAMYLISSPHSNMLGLYYLPLMFIAHETGLSIEGASKGLRSSIEAGFCAYDDDSEMVWVYEMAKYQIGDSLKPADKRCLGVQNEYNSLPDNPYLSGFYEKYSIAFCMTSKRGISAEMPRGLQGACEGHRSQEQEQEQEQIYLSLNAQTDFSDPLDFDERDQPDNSGHQPSQSVAADSCTGEQLRFTEQHLLLARTTGLGSEYSDSDIQTRFDLFRCYKANANTVKTQSEWLSNWRTWCQREKVNHAKQPNRPTGNGRSSAQPRNESGTQRAMRLAQEASERIASNQTGEGH